MDKFSPVGKESIIVLDDFFIKNNNSQIYMSATMSRYLGMPEKVVFLISTDGSEIAITTPDKVKKGGEYAEVRTTSREDSDALRLAGVPRYIMLIVEGKVAAKKVDKGLVTFAISKEGI